MTSSIREIADNFYMITLPMPFSPWNVNVFLAVYDGKSVIFDTGVNGPNTMSKLESSLKSIGQSIGGIEHIFITHIHVDHSSMAGEIRKRSGAVVHMSEIDRKTALIRQDPEIIRTYTRNFLAKHGFPKERIGGVEKSLDLVRNMFAPFDADETIKPFHKYTAGKRIFEPIPTPGHCHGHTSFFFPEDKILIAGDHVLMKITPNLSPDPFDPDFHPLNAFLDSLKTVGNLKIQTVWPAHGEPFSDLKKRIGEISDHHKERRDLILDSITKGPKTVFEISADIFGRNNLSGFDGFFALNETYVHIMELVHEGTVKERKEGRKDPFLAYEKITHG